MESGVKKPPAERWGGHTKDTMQRYATGSVPAVLGGSYKTAKQHSSRGQKPHT